MGKIKRNWCKKISIWLPNLYYAGTLVSLIIILAQVFYAKRSIVESSEWEKAKITIENVERFKVEISKSPMASNNVWILGDRSNPDFSTPEGWNSSRADSLTIIFGSLFEDDSKSPEEIKKEAVSELERMIDVMDAFAYPIIMGYASEIGSYHSVARQFYTYGAFIMPKAFSQYKNIGIHAKLLYRLWRVRFEQTAVDSILSGMGEGDIYITSELRFDFLFFNEDEVTLKTLRRYNKKIDAEIKKIKEEIISFRKGNYD